MKYFSFLIFFLAAFAVSQPALGIAALGGKDEPAPVNGEVIGGKTISNKLLLTINVMDGKNGVPVPVKGEALGGKVYPDQNPESPEDDSGVLAKAKPGIGPEVDNYNGC